MKKINKIRFILLYWRGAKQITLITATTTTTKKDSHQFEIMISQHYQQYQHNNDIIIQFGFDNPTIFFSIFLQIIIL